MAGKLFSKQAIIIAAGLFFAINIFAQGQYIWDNEHKCKVFTQMMGNSKYAFTYDGSCKDGFVSGNATVTFYVDNEKWSIFTGNFDKGVLNGYGRMEFLDAYIYEGALTKNDFDGKGKVTDTRTGEVAEGTFKGSAVIGDVKLTYANGDWYTGPVKNNWGSYVGKGTYHFKNGDYYTGDFNYFDAKDEVAHNGTMHYKSGATAEGYLKKRGEVVGFVTAPSKVAPPATVTKPNQSPPMVAGKEKVQQRGKELAKVNRLLGNIENPKVERGGLPGTRNLKIFNINYTKDYTIVSFVFYNGETFNNINFSSKAVLWDAKNGVSYKLIKAEEMFINEQRMSVPKNMEYYFSLFFEKIKPVEKINILECEGNDNCFNFYGVETGYTENGGFAKQPVQASGNLFADKKDALSYLGSDQMRILASKKQNGYWVNPYLMQVDKEVFTVAAQAKGKISEKNFMEDDDNDELKDLKVDEDKEILYEVEFAKITSVNISKDKNEEWWVTISGPFEDEKGKVVANEFRFVAYDDMTAMKYKDAVDMVTGAQKTYLGNVGSKFGSVDEARTFLQNNFNKASVINGPLLEIKWLPGRAVILFKDNSTKVAESFWTDIKSFKTTGNNYFWDLKYNNVGNNKDRVELFTGGYETKGFKISKEDIDAATATRIDEAFTYLREFFRGTQQSFDADEAKAKQIAKENGFVTNQVKRQNRLDELKRRFSSTSDAISYLKNNFASGYTFGTRISSGEGTQYFIKMNYSNSGVVFDYYLYNKQANTLSNSKSYSINVSWENSIRFSFRNAWEQTVNLIQKVHREPDITIRCSGSVFPAYIFGGKDDFIIFDNRDEDETRNRKLIDAFEYMLEFHDK